MGGGKPNCINPQRPFSNQEVADTGGVYYVVWDAIPSYLIRFLNLCLVLLALVFHLWRKFPYKPRL